MSFFWQKPRPRLFLKFLDELAAEDGTVVTDSVTGRRYVRQRGHWLEAPPRGAVSDETAQITRIELTRPRSGRHRG